jgi:hypothetical protein
MIAFTGNVGCIFHRFALGAAVFLSRGDGATASGMRALVIFGEFDFHGGFLSLFVLEAREGHTL